MYDCGKPVLVFTTQTLHPILEKHTGYIFSLYEFHRHKPVELFFQHIYEAQVFALYRGARLEMDPDNKPEQVTALDYVLNAEDDSRFDETEGMWAITCPGRKAQRLRAAEITDPPPILAEEEIPKLDFFGGDD